MKIGIFFASATGMTEEVAQKIAKRLSVSDADIHDVASATVDGAEAYDLFLLGSSTWEVGEMLSDWYDFAPKLKPHLSGKMVGLFGTGDSGSYGDSFVDAIGALYDEFADAGCTFVGSMPTEEYSYEASLAERDGQFVGLPIDEVNEDDRTDDRIEQWVSSLGL